MENLCLKFINHLSNWALGIEKKVGIRIRSLVGIDDKTPIIAIKFVLEDEEIIGDKISKD
jgi:hypothetical protein